MDTYITKAMRLIDDATAGLTPAQLENAPEGKWTAAQVLEHLARAFGTSAKAMELALEKPQPTVRALTIKDRVGIFLVTGLGYFPEGRKAPAITVPGDNPRGPETVQRIKENLARCGKAIDACEAKWGSSNRILDHPVLGPLTPSQWRKFHFVHTRHHMKQVRERSAFVASRSATV